MTSTLCDAFQQTAAIDPSAVALRTVGGDQQITWAQYRERVQRVAAGLAAIGVASGDAIALLLTNRPEFHVVDTAALHLGAIPFSVYNTLAPEQINFLLENANCRVVVTEKQYLDKIRTAGGPVKHVVLVDHAADDTVTLADLERDADPHFDFDAAWRSVQPGDVATLIYTSGTTGNPKGVELTHANLLAEIEGITALVDVNFGDRITSYLPTAHIADRLSTHYVQMIKGSQITTVADARKIAEALPDARPTFWVAVPRVWEKLKIALEAAMADTRGPKALLLRRAMALGYQNARGSLNPVQRVELKSYDRLVLAKIRAKLGFEELRWALCGAAPSAPETLEFFMALGIEVLEMWGMSECCGAGTVNPRGRARLGTVGIPLPNLELKVADDGELLVRGPIVMNGYRNDPERTAEAFDADGWFATGDVVTVDADGYVTIIDRKKELIINAGGKNMSPTNIENTIKVQCPLIGQLVAIGDNRPYNTALVVLDPDAARLYAEHNGLADASASTMAADPGVAKAIEAGIAAGNAKLSRIEQIKRFQILPMFWEPGGEELTPTMKLKRKPIATKYAADIERLYASSPGLV